jgi:hypothetical protein
MRHCTLKVNSQGGKRVLGFVSIRQHTLDLTDQQEFRKPTTCVLSRPGFLRSQNKVHINLEIFLIGYSIGSVVPIGPVSLL